MGKKRKRAPLVLAVGKKEKEKKTLKKKEMRKVTSDFHRLSSQLESLRSSLEMKKSHGTQSEISQVEKHISDIENQIADLGGRSSYQQASHQATSSFSTSKWIIGDLQRRGFKAKGGKGKEKEEEKGKEEGVKEEEEAEEYEEEKREGKEGAQPSQKGKLRKRRVLEIGAVNEQLLSCSWLDVRAIDLLSSSPRIEAIDFFSLSSADVTYDVIVCSMVLNCLPAPALRFRGTVMASFASFYLSHQTHDPRGRFVGIAQHLLREKYPLFPPLHPSLPQIFSLRHFDREVIITALPPFLMRPLPIAKGVTKSRICIRSYTRPKPYLGRSSKRIDAESDERQQQVFELAL